MKRQPTQKRDYTTQDAIFMARALEDIDRGIPHWRKIARELESRFPELFGGMEDDPPLQEEPEKP